MRKSRLSPWKQARLIEYFVSGTTARTTAALVGVNKSTAAYYFLRLRMIITQTLAEEMPFAGAIEVDESYGRSSKGQTGTGCSRESASVWYSEAWGACVHGSDP